MIKKILKQLVSTLVLAYLVFGLFLFVFQNSFIYFPDNQDFNNCKALDYAQKVNFNETRFYYGAKEKSQDLVVFYHGNAGSACDRAIFGNFFYDDNFSFIIVEYSGYSNDNKKPSKENIFNDVDNVNNYILKLNYSNFYIGSESIGSVFASYHTSILNPKKIFFIAPFDELKNVVKDKLPIYPTNLMLKENYNNVELLENYKGEVIFFHGENDNIVSPKLSLNLFNSINSSNKTYILKENKGHNDIYNKELFSEIILLLKK